MATRLSVRKVAPCRAGDARADWRSDMEKVAVAVMPIADLEAWREFAEEIDTGDRAEAHRAFLHRGGVQAEHLFHQQTPMGDLAVLVWEGVDPEQLGAHMSDLMQNPATDHERYLRDHVVAKIHGIDLDQAAPPPAQRLATLTP
jgi:hypothetical protein